MKVKQKANSSKINSPAKSSSKSPQKKYASHISASDSGTNENENARNIESVTTVEHHEGSPDASENESNSRSIFTVEDITSDDEVYTFQSPETLVKQELCNKYLDFINSKTLATKSGTFGIELLTSEKKHILLAMPKNGSRGSLCKLPLKGHIVLHKSVDITSNETVDEDDSNTNAVVFPSDLKVRHPLLGVDWEAHVQQADEMINKSSYVKKKSKKIKKEKTSEFDVVECKTLKREHSQVEMVVHKQKRKKIFSQD